MNKKYVVSAICASALMLAGFVGAVTSVENSTSTSANTNMGSTGATGTVQTEVKLDSKVDAIVNRLDTKIDTTAESSARVLPTVNKVDEKDSAEGSSERLLPTVNKKTGAKVQVMGWDPVKKEAIRAKIDAAVETNAEIKEAEVSEDEVKITYSAPAKFLGMFPGHFNLHVSSDAQARVKVKFPWYRFLLKTEFANTAELLNGVFQHNQTNLEFLKSKASEDRQVEIFITISNSLKIMHDMSKSIIGNIKA